MSFWQVDKINILKDLTIFNNTHNLRENALFLSSVQYAKIREHPPLWKSVLYTVFWLTPAFNL